eukprot:XP_001708647.1 Hypothetical protein GL50803_106135 [Giardia lamblia ATCC 50803]
MLLNKSLQNAYECRFDFPCQKLACFIVCLQFFQLCIVFHEDFKVSNTHVHTKVCPEGTVFLFCVPAA